MEAERPAMDDAVLRYAPKYPRKSWLKNILTGVLVGWLVGVVAYGAPLFNRYTNVRHTEIVAAQNASYDHLLRMVAGLDPTTKQGNLGRLADLVRQLRGPGYPNMVALRNYTVGPGEFAPASDMIGGGLTTQDDPKTDYGRFDRDFLNDTVEAVPGQVSHELAPTDYVRSWGNLQWQYLALGSGGLWAGIGLLCLLLVMERKLWELRALGKFVNSLSYEDREVLALVDRILKHPSRRDYLVNLNKGDRVFALVRGRDEGSDSDIEDELEHLRAIYDDNK